MSGTIRPIPAVGALAISAVSLLIAANLHTSASKGLVVHEWGTFTSVAGEDGSAVDWDVLGGKDDLPHFVNDRGYRGFKSTLSGTVRMETPVLYFYSSSALHAHVKVAFPKGLITEWYPKAEYQVDQKSGIDGSVHRLPSNLNGIDLSLRSLTGGIEWPDVSVEPGTSPDLPREGSPSRYYAARSTDATPVAVEDQHEKFLFYRGVGRFGVPLSAKLSADGKVTLENCGSDVVPMAIRFENRAGRIGYRIGGAVSGSLALDTPSTGADFAPLSELLKNTLVAQGLFPREAQAMIETWRDSWFEEGSRIIYIVPSRTVNAVLPLQVDPVPFQTVRVFVGRIELITPETEQTVQAALATNDRCLVDRYGRFLGPILARISSDDLANAREVNRFRESLGRAIGSATCP
jgi:hypothetical protein